MNNKLNSFSDILSSPENAEVQNLWKHVRKISDIPHGSNNESELRNYLIRIADREGLEYEKDDIGNLIIRKPAQNSSSDKALILQSHMDMIVTPKDSKFPLDLEIKEHNWLSAKNSSAGFDNNIGIAATLDILEDKEMSHPPLECIFTVQEETGMHGAENCKFDVKGRTLINLDSEKIDEIAVGSAGGKVFESVLQVEQSKVPKEFSKYQIDFLEFEGGHSGADIDANTGNPIKTVNSLLIRLASQGIEYYLQGIQGGETEIANLIPQNAKISIYLKDSDFDTLKKETNILIEKCRQNHNHDAITANIKKLDRFDEDMALSSISTKDLINYIEEIPSGVIEKEGQQVLQSTNLGYLITTATKVHIVNLYRSVSSSELEKINKFFTEIGDRNNIETKETFSFPPCKQNKDSEICEVIKKVYAQLSRVQVREAISPGGLECKTLAKSLVDDYIDMISIGSTIVNPHSTREKVNIESVKEFLKILKGVLEYLA